MSAKYTSFTSLTIGTLSTKCVALTTKKQHCKEKISSLAHQKAKQILQNIKPDTDQQAVCWSIIRLADHCVCEFHPHRETATNNVTTRWLADYDALGATESRQSSVRSSDSGYESVDSEDIASTDCHGSNPDEQTQQVESPVNLVVAELETKTRHMATEQQINALINDVQVLQQIRIAQLESLQCRDQEIHQLRHILAQKEKQHASSMASLQLLQSIVRKQEQEVKPNDNAQIPTNMLNEDFAKLRVEHRALQASKAEQANRLSVLEKLNSEQANTIRKGCAETASLQQKLQVSENENKASTDKIKLLESALEAYQEGIAGAKQINESWSAQAEQLKAELESLKSLARIKDEIIIGLEARLQQGSASSRQPSVWDQGDRTFLTPSAWNSRPVSPMHSPWNGPHWIAEERGLSPAELERRGSSNRAVMSLDEVERAEMRRTSRSRSQPGL